MSDKEGWIGVDFDGTLAHYESGQFHPLIFGAPIMPMVERVKRWLDEGRDVRIFTARMDMDPNAQAMVREAIGDWCETHIGQVLPITNVKDFAMLELWDDRAVAVEPNTGKPLSPSRRGLEP